MRGRLPNLALILVATALVACADGTPDGAPTATASPTPAASVTEVGGGTVLESEWRYSVGDMDGGWCTRLVVAETSSSRCGDLTPAEGDAFGMLGRGPNEYTEAQVVEGLVSADAATVWLVGDGEQYRIPAVLMPLDELGLEGVQAYVGFARADVDLTHVQAVAFNGDVLETLELP